jgi:hypothetical protein
MPIYGMRRFTRLTNAFSRKVENLAAAVSLHFMYYNFADLTKRRLRRGTFPSLDHLVKAIVGYLEQRNAIRSPLSGRRLSTASLRSCAVVCPLLRRSTRAPETTSTVDCSRRSAASNGRPVTPLDE